MEILPKKEVWVMPECKICNKTFTKKSGKKRHDIKFHGLLVEPKNTGIVCFYCERQFSNNSNRNVHLKKAHSMMEQPLVAYEKDKFLISCDECNISFPSLNVYREHLQRSHMITTNKVQHNFSTNEEFLAWKNSLELDVGVNYTAHSGAYKTTQGMKSIYYCRRSGAFKSKVDESNRKRSMKKQGTCKLGSYCTSSMEVITTENNVNVTLYYDHYGHNVKEGSQDHMNIPKYEKDKIADMITQGLNHEEILESLREASSGIRISSVTKKDLFNICVEYGLQDREYRHPEDSESVLLTIREMQENGEVLYFKDKYEIHELLPEIPAKDFVLAIMKKGQKKKLCQQLESGERIQVCIDSIHCINEYKGYQLTTLMTITDSIRGFPVAFLISSRVTIAIIETFFNSIKEQVGVINAHIFMSDDDLIYRNSWEEVMGGEDGTITYLNCNWHTERTFKSMIASKIIGPINEKLSVYQMLRVLMDEQDEEVFHEKRVTFLNYLQEAGLIGFHDYFIDHYLSEERIKMWPQCFRSSEMLKTNIHMESMHKLMRHVYLKGKRIERLDCTLTALNKMVQVKLFNKMVDMMQNRAVSDTERHQKGKNLKVVGENKGIFKVSSLVEYKVEAQNLTCTVCRDRCPYCHVCKCMYICSCEDNSNGTKNVCQHIHAVVNHFQKKVLPVPPESKQGRKIFSDDTSSNDYLEKLINTISNFLLPTLKEVKDIEVLRTVDSQLENISDIIKAHISSKTESDSRNDSQQDEKEGNVEKPSTMTTEEIQQALLKSQYVGSYRFTPILPKGVGYEDILQSKKILPVSNELPEKTSPLNTPVKRKSTKQKSPNTSKKRKFEKDGNVVKKKTRKKAAPDKTVDDKPRRKRGKREKNVLTSATAKLEIAKSLLKLKSLSSNSIYVPIVPLEAVDIDLNIKKDPENKDMPEETSSNDQMASKNCTMQDLPYARKRRRKGQDEITLTKPKPRARGKVRKSLSESESDSQYIPTLPVEASKDELDIQIKKESHENSELSEDTYSSYRPTYRSTAKTRRIRNENRNLLNKTSPPKIVNKV